MAKPRVTATNRLADVIEVVELGRRTGLLMVERGSGEMLEEGAIYFHAGHATFAAVERVRGQDALNVLGGWGGCRFSFDPDAAPLAPNLAFPQPARAASNGQDHWAGSTPGHYAPPSQAPRRDPSGPRTWYTPASPPPAPLSQPASGPTGPFSSSWPDPRASSTPGMSGGMNGGQGSTPTSGSLLLPQNWPLTNAPLTGPIPSASPPPTSFPTSGLTGMPAQQRTDGRPGADATLLRRPRRAPTVRDLLAVVQTYNLSRAHRTLLMLADGEHNVIDLARLSSKPIEEVLTLLRELESQGLVYYY